MASGKAAVWSGFWARLWAWIIDFLVLGAVCLGVGWAAIDHVSAWGSNGRAFGLVLGVIYFGLTASGLFGGRSIGMRVCGLKVTGLGGRPLGLPAAIGRAVLLVGPLMLNGWSLDFKDSTPAYVFDVVAITAVFGVSLAQIYLLLFNLPTHRLVHDLVFRSVVVRHDAKDFTVPPAGVHAVVATVLVLAALGLALAAPSILQAWMPNVQAVLSPEQRVVDAVNALPEVVVTGVNDNTTTVYATSGPANVSRTLVVTARVRVWPANVNRELARIGAATTKVYHFAPAQQLTVKIIYGFDLGFGSYSYSQGDQFATTCTTADVNCLVR